MSPSTCEASTCGVPSYWCEEPDMYAPPSVTSADQAKQIRFVEAQALC
jgi:hypothetical protein